ncbi:MAG: VWA domain-containing protein [Clostridia bacterium]|nr:VWA domain-containing protein [Clostridia bacterium]
MNIKRKWIAVVLALLFMLQCISMPTGSLNVYAKEKGNEKPAALIAIEMDSNEYRLSVGQSYQTVVRAVYSDGSKVFIKEPVIFESAKSAVAEVDESGVVTGKGQGETSITAGYYGKTAVSRVVVRDERPTQTPIPTDMPTPAVTATVTPVSTLAPTQKPKKELPDLMVTDIIWEPTKPAATEKVVFAAEIKNIGKSEVLPGERFHVGFYIGEGNEAVWANVYSPSINPGESIKVYANEGLGGGTWSAREGRFKVTAFINTENNIQESKEKNNKLTKNLVVLPMPIELELDEEDGLAAISWKPVDGVQSYLIKRGTSPDKLNLLNAHVSETKYVDTKVKAGQTYYYAVSYIKNGVESANSNIVVWALDIKAPEVDCLQRGNTVKLSWPRVPGAVKYTVYRGLQPGGPYEEVEKETNKILFIDNKVNVDTTYYYAVKAIGKNGRESKLSEEVKVTVEKKTGKVFDPAGDDDEDGLTNEDELLQGTDMNEKDTDGDGTSDYDEIKVKKSDPLKSDLRKRQGQRVQKAEDKSKKTKRQIKTEDNRVTVDVNGYESLESAPLKVEELEDEFLKSLKGIVGKPVDITAGNVEIEKADISISYDEAELMGVSEDDLAIFWVDEENKKLVKLDDLRIDKERNMVTAATPHFSKYILGNVNMAQDLGKVDIIFAIDQSEGMETSDHSTYLTRLEVVKKFVQNMKDLNTVTINGTPTETDNLRIGILEFSEFSNIKSLPTNNQVVLMQKLNGMDYVIGGTNIADALWVSKEQFEYYDNSSANEEGKRRKIIVLLTDGKDTTGNVSGGIVKIAENLNNRYTDKVEAIYNHITVNTVAIGNSADSQVLKDIAEKTEGSYLFMNNYPNPREEDLKEQVNLVYDKLIKQLVLQNKTTPPEEILEIEEVIHPTTFSEKFNGLDSEEALKNYVRKTGSNILTGNFLQHQVDINIPSSGMDLTLERTYNSDSGAEKSVLGNGWRLKYDMEIRRLSNCAIVTGSQVNIWSDDGRVSEETVTKGAKLRYILNQTDNSKIKTTSNGYDWYYVETAKKVKGWVCGIYIKELPGTESIEVNYGSGTKVIYEYDSTGSTASKKVFIPDYGTLDNLEMAYSLYFLVTKDQTRYTFEIPPENGVGRLISIIDANGNGVTIVRNTDGTVKEVKDIFGRKLTFEYRDNKLWKVTDPANRFVVYSYDENDNLVSVRDLGEKITQYTYYNYKDASSNFEKSKIKEVIDANGNVVVKNDYDPYGRLVRQYDGNGFVTYQMYNDLIKDERTGLRISKDTELARYYIDANGNESKIEYNIAEKQPVKETDANGDYIEHRYYIYNGSGDWINDEGSWYEVTKDTFTTDTTYKKILDGTNRPTKEILFDKKRNKVEVRYDKMHNLCKEVKEITNSNGTITKYETLMQYDKYNNLYYKKEVDGSESRYTYEEIKVLNDEDSDPNNDLISERLKSTTDAMGNEIVYSYYTPGTDIGSNLKIGLKSLVKSVTENRKNKSGVMLNNFKTTTYEYVNGYNYRSKIIDTLGNETLESYDGNGRLKEIKNARGYTSKYTYDDMNRVIEEEDSLGKKTTLQYDNVGNKRFVTDKNVHTTEYIYDAESQLVEVKDAKGYSTKFRYDGVGNKVEETNARGYSRYYDYDNLNRLVRSTDARGFTTQYTYDKNNNTLSVIDPTKTETLYEYDDLNRKTKEKWQYKNEAGQMVTVTASEYTYNLDNSIDQVKNAKGKVTKYAYDKLGRVTSVIDGYNPAYGKGPDGFYTGPKDVFGTFTGNIETTTTYDVVIDPVLGKLEKVTVTDPKHYTAIKESDPLGRVRRVTDAKGNKTLKTYDSVGNLIEDMDAKNHKTTYAYDGLNRLITETDPISNFASFEYDNVGNVTAKVNKKGYRTVFRYNELDQLTEEENALHKITSYTYDEVGNKLSATDPLGNTVSFRYDADNRLLAETDGEGNTKYYQYDEAGNKYLETGRKEYTDITEPYIYTIELEDGTTDLRMGVRFEYDSLNRLVRTFDAKDQKILEKTYDVLGNVIKETDGKGNWNDYQYDILNRLRVTNASGDSSMDEHTVDYLYDLNGNLEITISALGETVTNTYDSLNRIIKTVEEKQCSDIIDILETSRDYDANGNVAYEIDGNKNKTTYTYDDLDRVIDETVTVSGKSRITAYRYDANGNLVSTTDWKNNVAVNQYDELDRLKAKAKRNPGQSEDIVLQRFEYYDNGTQWKSIDALGNTTEFFYDRNNWLIRTVDPELHVTGQTYDEDGNIKTKTDGEGNQTTFHYDINNRLEAVENAKHEITSYTYDINGNMLTQKNDKGYEVTYEYNAGDKVAKRIDHGGRWLENGSYVYNDAKVEKYEYLGNGSLKRKVDREGAVASYEYYLHGKVKTMTVTKTGKATVSLFYNYDFNGNLTEITDSAGKTSRTYDALDRVLVKRLENAQGGLIGESRYEYDITLGLPADVPNGSVAEKATDPKGNITHKIYDNEGRLISVIDGELTSPKRTNYTYFANGNRQSVVYPDGSKEVYTYYNDNLLKTLTNYKKDGTIMDTYSYTYNNAHNQLSKTEYINQLEKGSTTYTYDDLNRLETVLEPGTGGKLTVYTYDRAGNRETETVTQGQTKTTDTYAYNEQNRLVSVTKTDRNTGSILADTSFEYDKNGNQLKVKQTRYTGGTPIIEETVNSYDLLNQLTQTIKGDKTINNVYNSEGLRISMSVITAGQTPVKTTRYFYEYDKVVLETDGNGAQTARNIYGTNLLSRNTDGITLYYMYNGHGDVTALIDTNGILRATYYYDAFGNVLDEKQYDQNGNPTATGVNNPFGYAGYVYDKENGLYYLNARMYDPKIARFLQEDTYLGDPNDPLSLNLYTYCFNNPIMYFDPTGHMWVDQETYHNVGGVLKRENTRVWVDDEKYYAESDIGTMRKEANTTVELARMYQDKATIEKDTETKKKNTSASILNVTLPFYNDNPSKTPTYQTSNVPSYTDHILNIARANQKAVNKPGLWSFNFKPAESVDNLTGTMASSAEVTAEVLKERVSKLMRNQPRPNNIQPRVWNSRIEDDIAKFSSKTSKFAKGAKIAGVAGVGFGVGFGIYENIQEGAPTKKIASDAVVDTAFGGGGLLTSMAAGAGLGTLGCPVVGTVIGGAAAGILYMIGTEVWEPGGQSIKDRAKEGLYNSIK